MQQINMQQINMQLANFHDSRKRDVVQKGKGGQGQRNNLTQRAFTSDTISLTHSLAHNP